MGPRRDNSNSRDNFVGARFRFLDSLVYHYDPFLDLPKFEVTNIIHNVINRVKQALGGRADKREHESVIIPREQHGISRKDISDNALKVLYRLHNGGYEAYLVGGCVRDLMLGLKPKDFDVTTNATPEQVKALFNNCRLIGRRFRLAHVMFGREIIEVATFRGHHDDDAGKQQIAKSSHEGQILRDNVYGSIEEDAERRDFTINAMYYNIADFSIRDFAGGQEAINKRVIELIGDPEVRYREDPVRMLRAVRFAAKLDMQISPSASKPILTLASLLNNIPPARLFEEFCKLYLSGQGLKTHQLLIDYHLLGALFPILLPFVSAKNGKEVQLIEQMLINTDERVNQNQPVTPAFVLASLLWYPMEMRVQELKTDLDISDHDARLIAMGDTLDRQTQRIMIPKRFSVQIRDIWHLQYRLGKRAGRRAFLLLEHPKFRAAYDFLLLRAKVEGGDLDELARWWTDFQQASHNQKQKMVGALQGDKTNSRRRRRKPKMKKPNQ